VELQSRFDEIEGRGLGLVAILYDPPATIKAFTGAHDIEFPVLSDEGSEVIRRYDLLNREQETDPGNRFFGIPYPGTFILDNAGRVTERFFEQRYQERFTVSSLLTRLADPAGGAARDATLIETNHLEALSYASDSVVAPGNRFSLLVDVTPKAGMHVYAPGDHTYQVIRLRLNTLEFVQSHDTSYPAAESYHFEPLDETVPVYVEPFRIVQEITIPMSPEIAALAGEPDARLTIEGTLEYQACDDEICYLPVDVPVSWEFEWRPLVRN
jgi:hypothetical protein